MLTPKQLVAAIKLDEAVKARPPSERQIKTSTNQTLLDPVREFQRAMSEERDRLNASREAPKAETSAAPAVVELTDEQRAAVAGWLALPAITRRSFAIELGDVAGRVGSTTSRAALLALLKAFEPKDCSA